MVHALQECWRVLTPDGGLVDIRPLASEIPIDVIDDRGVQTAGFVDNSSWVQEEEASARALNSVLRKRYLKKDLNGKAIETPDELFQRVSEFIASAEKNYPNGEENYIKFKDEF